MVYSCIKYYETYTPKCKQSGRIMVILFNFSLVFLLLYQQFIQIAHVIVKYIQVKLFKNLNIPKWVSPLKSDLGLLP